MTVNLFRDSWTDFDPAELRLLLDEHFGGPGQYDDRSESPNKLYLPRARSSCRVVLTFDGNRITAIERGHAFDASAWCLFIDKVEKSIRAGTMKVGRDYSFSGFRVSGSWRGECSGVQILPPPDDAPSAHVGMAEHPFILEFPIKVSDCSRVTNHRRMQEHRKLTLLLNVLLAGRTSFQPRRSDGFWVSVPSDGNDFEMKWGQRGFIAPLGSDVIDELSPPAAERLGEVDPEEYFTTVGYDGKGLRVPFDLDESICCYKALSAEKQAKFDRAAFWFDMASRQWNTSVSASFAALVSAVESLTQRGDIHHFRCPECGERTQHEVPGATRRFKDFFETYAPEDTPRKRRDEMYSLRSGILHGSELMQLDQDLDFGWDPPWWNERELNAELWGLTRAALRNWLKKSQTT